MILGSIKEGKYNKGDHSDNSLPVPSPLVKAGEIESQRFDHQWELVQPYKADGTVNEEFTIAYPEEAATYGFINQKRDY